ncbi:MAG TPA: hypothetical protein VLF93_07850 [Candidatus Saccharimonadales bacterium]|nr:hypothetical protein [Candidatus Saccharimonadales bacterium]
MKKITYIISRYNTYFVFLFLLALSAFFSALYYFNGENILYADTMSRLDIARKIVDNLTPGFAQIGNVWLPLPQLLMVPFIWNNFLWHSGLAGAIMSGTAFIIGGLYIYKSVKLLTNSILSSLLSLCVYALNLNILYLQSTAMSETLFTCTLAASIYYLLVWIKTNNIMYLIPAGLAVSAMTYTRYEGWSVLFGAIPMIFVVAWMRNKKLLKSESSTILFTFLAITGFLAWTLYLALIFGDPLYWAHYYVTPAAAGNGGKAVAHVYSQQKPFLAAVWQYFTSCVWMIGLIPMILAIFGTLIMIVQSIWKRSLYIFPLLLPLAIFLFMTLTLQRNTPIVQPNLTIGSILSPTTSDQIGFNVRYGILLLPWVAIIISYIFTTTRIRFLFYILFCAVFAIQLGSYFHPHYSVLYQIPEKIYPKADADLVNFMRTHYNGGEILISAAGHEDQMFEMGFNYRTYIHEGAGKYWKESIDDPPHYATWIIFDLGQNEDAVAKYMYDPHRKAALQRDFNLVFTSNKGLLRVYKIKTKPYFSVPTT